MNKLVLLRNDGRIIGIAGHAWKLLPGQRRQLLAEGERLTAGELIELEGNADILIQPITAGALSVGELPGANVSLLSETPSVTLATDERSDDQKAAIEEQTADEGLMTPTTIPLLTPSITPDAGIGTGLDNLPVALATLSDQPAMDYLALITIDTPITPDNIVNDRESRALTIAGRVVNVEPLRPVILTLTDQVGHQWQLQTAVNSDGSSWQIEADLTGSGLLDGIITITAETSDLAGNSAKDSTTFLLDTITEVTLELAPQSDSCYGQAADTPDNPTNDNTPVIIGTGEVNSTVALFSDGQLLASGISVGSNGTWSAHITQPLSDGSHTLTAQITDVAGNTTTAELILTIDTEASIWINDINTYGIDSFDMPITGETAGIENGRPVTLIFGSVPVQNRVTTQVPVEDNHWNHPAFMSPITGGESYQVQASVEDCACSIATDHLMPLGNPSDINIQESVDLGVTRAIDPIAASDTVLSIESAYLTDLPDNITIIDSGTRFPVSWQINDPKTLTAVYQDGTSTRTALTFTLPDSGTGLASLQVDRAFFHPGDSDEISFTLPYQKSLYSPTCQKTHYSKAGLMVTMLDNVPTLVDHTPVLVEEGTTARWSEHNGKLFTPTQAGGDGGLLSAINDTPLSGNNHKPGGDTGVFYPFPGQYGTLYVTPDGAWNYTAKPDQKHTTDTTLTETFTFTVTDTDGDSDSATIRFTVLDGTALSFSTDTVSAMTIDQECDQPGPIADSGQITVLKGSDPLPPDQLQFDIYATSRQLNNALASRLPTSDGDSLDLDNLHPGPENQSLVLSTLTGKPVLSMQLDNISTDTTSGNLSADLVVQQLANLDVTEPEPSIMPVVLTASDHDINTISHTVTLSVIDGGVTLKDDHIEVTEGETVTGNLLGNDVQCLETLTVTKVSLDRFYLDKNTTANTGQLFDFQTDTSIQTLYGTLTVKPDGNYTYTARDSLYHPDQQPLPQEFTYTVTDSSGDTGRAAVFVTIYDGAAATGDEQVKLTFIEDNLTTSPRYPGSYTGFVTTLSGNGSDAIDPLSLRFTADPAKLNGIVTSLGTPVSFTAAGNQLRGSIIENDQSVAILTLSLSAIGENHKDLLVRVDGQLDRPLDHLAGTLGNDSVMVNGERIILSLPFTFDDIDGTPAAAESTVTATIFDGKFPLLSNPGRINIDEVDLPVSDTGTIDATPKSDQIVPDSWRFSAKQPGLDGLFASDQPLAWSTQGSTLTLHSPDQSPVLTITLNDQPLPAQPATLNYSVTLSHPMDQDKGSWPLSVAVAVTDSDGDTSENRIPIQINDVSNQLQLALAINDLEMTEPLYQKAAVSERVNVHIHADTDAVTNVWFLRPAVDSSGFALDDDNNRLTADGLPIKYFASPANSRYPETWEAWSMQGSTQKDPIFSLTTIQNNGSAIQVPPGSSTTATVGVTWSKYLDHMAPNGQNIPMLPVSYTLQAVDSDGSTTSDDLTLSLLDGEYPTPGKITQPPTTTDINKGDNTSVAGTLDYTPGSDRPVPVFDRFTIGQEMASLSSDGNPLTGIAVSGPDQSVLTISRANDDLPVFRFSVKNPQPNTATIQFEQLDNLDHPPLSASQNEAITLTIPVLMSDSDKSLNTTPANFLYTVVDTVPVANGNYYWKNNQPIGEEGKTFSYNLKNNDTLNADADNARLSAITYQNMVYPVSPTGTTTITTDAGILTVRSNGKWRLPSKPHIDHSAGQDFTLKMFSTIVDGDGDNSSAPFEITIEDQPAKFINVVNTQGDEDTPTPVTLSFSIDLGDLDRDETLTSLSVSTSDLQGGQLTFNGTPLAASGNTVAIHDNAISRTMVEGSAILSAENLGYLPAANVSDFTLTNHQVTLNLNATISKNPGPDQSLSTPLTIHISGIADPPRWPETIPPLQGLEDTPLPLQNNGAPIRAFLQDTDGSEQLSYKITQLPDNLQLTLPDKSPVSTGATLSPEQFEQLTITPTEHWSGQAAISVTAIATEQGYSTVDSASTPATIIVNIHPVADPPLLTLTPTGAQPHLVLLTGFEDQPLPIGSNIKAQLVDDDGSESLFIRITPLVEANESHGILWIKNNGDWQKVALTSGYFETAGSNIPYLYYQPGQDRSSANFTDVKLQVNAISRESIQSGIPPALGKEQAISDNGYLEIKVFGDPDQPAITPGSQWTINENVLQGHGYEDAPLPLQLTVTSGDIDGSESLNLVVELADQQFLLQNSTGKAPPIASVTNGVPAYQLTAEALQSGVYSIIAPGDFAGQTELTMTVLVTEADGASKPFTYRLNAIFAPVVDTEDQSSDTINGIEVTLDSENQLMSGGAPLTLSGIELKDTDGSESITDISGIDLPSGFGLLVNDQLFNNSDSSLSNLSLVTELGGLDGLKTALNNKKILIVPINPGGTLNSHYPTPDNHTTHFTFDLTVEDAQNGLETGQTIKIDSTINWRGEVDGDPTGGTPVNPDDNTRVTIGNPPPASGNDFPLTDLQLVSTDTDGSESLMTGKVPQYEINVFDQDSEQIVVNGWNLQTTGNQQLIFTTSAWLVQSGGLAGVSVHFTRAGNYVIQIKGIVEDVGDQEARFARFSVTVNQGSDASANPVDPENIVVCDISGNEDGWITIPSACINTDLSHTTADEQTVMQIEASEIKGWELKGYTSGFWNDNGKIVNYVILPDDFANLQFSPPRDFSGNATIPYQILKQNTLSDNTSSTPFTIAFDIAPVVENSPEESAHESQYDLKVWVSPPARAPEWKTADQSSPMNLHLEPTDIDGSETLETVVFSPPDHISLKGSGLVDNTASRSAGETTKAFAQRIASFAFTPEQGLTAGTYPMSFTVEVIDTAPGTGKTNQKTFASQMELIVTPVNNCTTLEAPDQAGYEDTIILITGLSARLNDQDGSETVSVTLSGVPEKAVLSDSTGATLPFNGNGQWQIPASLISNNGQIQPLNFLPVRDFSGTIPVTLNAYSHEASLSEVCVDQKRFNIQVQPVGDAVTVNQLPNAMEGNENSPLVFLLDAKTTDTHTTAEDFPEGLRVTVNITGDVATLFPAQSNATQPSLAIPGHDSVAFSPTSDGYSATVETTKQSLQEVVLNPGDGHGTFTVSVVVQSIDHTQNMNTAFGPSVKLTTTATILPKSDPPTLQVDRDHIFANNQVPVPLAIKASVVNPAFNLNTPTGTELYVQISGLPSSASLVNGLSEPVGSSTGITGTIALTTDQLSDLYLLNTATGNYQLSVQSVSEIDAEDRQTSSVVSLSVNVIEDQLTINGTPGDDIIVANGTAPLINGNAGDDLIAAGPGTSTIYPGPGNNDVWGGSYQSTEQDHQDTFAFQQGDNGNTTIYNYEPGIDHIDLSELLNLQAVWDSAALAGQVVISENAGNTLLSLAGEVITLESVPMDTLLPDSSPMTPAGYLSALVSSGNLVVSNQFGHEGKDILHAPTTGELIADDIVYGAGGDDELYGNPQGSQLSGGPGNDQLILVPDNNAKDILHWQNTDAGTVENPFHDLVTGFQTGEDIIDISGYLPSEAENQPFAFMELSLNNNNTLLNLASAAPAQWTNTIELAGVDWLQGSSSEDALKYQMEQGYLITGLPI